MRSLWLMVFKAKMGVVVCGGVWYGVVVCGRMGWDGVGWSRIGWGGVTG
jgi:hypothetical protein